MSHRSRAQSPQGNSVVQDGNGSWSGCAFLPACNRFLPFRHLLPWLLAHLQVPPSGQADLERRHFQILGNSWEGPAPSCSLVQKDARGDKRTNLCKKWPCAIPLLAWPKGASFAPACRVPLAQWLERSSYEP